MTMREFSMLKAPIAGAMIACWTLAGCAMNDDSVGRLLADPGKYRLYNCPALAEVVKSKIIREQKLQGLMAKAEAGSGGSLASTLAYRPDYLQVRGELDNLRQVQAEKHCDQPQVPPAAAAAPGAPAR